jgi:hypothetical protein
VSNDYGGILTIFSPYTYHAPALIIGDREGLEALQEAIDFALRGVDEEISHAAYVFDAHGEGYAAVVAVVPTATAGKGSAAYADDDSPPSYGPALGNSLKAAGLELRFRDLTVEDPE